MAPELRKTLYSSLPVYYHIKDSSEQPEEEIPRERSGRVLSTQSKDWQCHCENVRPGTGVRAHSVPSPPPFPVGQTEAQDIQQVNNTTGPSNQVSKTKTRTKNKQNHDLLRLPFPVV